MLLWNDWNNNLKMASNALIEDLDRGVIYDLDESTRDRLLAQARLDASHALLNTKSIMDTLNLVLVIVAVILLWEFVDRFF